MKIVVGIVIALLALGGWGLLFEHEYRCRCAQEKAVAAAVASTKAEDERICLHEKVEEIERSRAAESRAAEAVKKRDAATQAIAQLTADLEKSRTAERDLRALLSKVSVKDIERKLNADVAEQYFKPAPAGTAIPEPKDAPAPGALALSTIDGMKRLGDTGLALEWMKFRTDLWDADASSPWSKDQALIVRRAILNEAIRRYGWSAKEMLQVVLGKPERGMTKDQVRWIISAAPSIDSSFVSGVARDIWHTTLGADDVWQQEYVFENGRLIEWATR